MEPGNPDLQQHKEEVTTLQHEKGISTLTLSTPIRTQCWVYKLEQNSWTNNEHNKTAAVNREL